MCTQHIQTQDSAGDREHCAAQGTGSIVQRRGQGALCSAGDKEHCVVQRTGNRTESIPQVRGQAALCSVEGRLANYARVQSMQVQVYVRTSQYCSFV